MESFGFSNHDIALLLFCPIFSVIGGITHAYVLWADYSTLPDKDSFVVANHKEASFRIAWLFGRLLLSFIAGLVFSLSLVGSLTSTPATTARIFALSILVGYVAPKFWITQEAIISEIVESKLKKLLPEEKKEQA